MKLHPSFVLLSTLLLGGCATTEISQTAPVAAPAPTPVKAAKVTAPEFAPMATTLPTIAAPTIPAVSAAPAPASPAAASPELAPEVTALVVRLTDSEKSDALAHDISDTTGFPEAMASLAPGAHAPKVEALVSRTLPPPRGLTADGDSVNLIERDWTGLVLIPINKSLSKAYTSAVRLLKVEAHPLQDGRIRVWIRMQNIAQRGLPSEIACAFSMHGDTQPISPNFYELDVPSKEYRDVFFVSPAGDLDNYTVLIRSNPIDYKLASR